MWILSLEFSEIPHKGSGKEWQGVGEIYGKL